MNIRISTYIPAESAVHTCDARVKIVLLVAYTVTIFCVRTWVGLALCACVFFAVAAASHVPLRRYFSLLVPVYVIAGFAVLFNSFSGDVAATAAGGGALGLGNVSAGLLTDAAPVALVGSFGFVPAGFARGCFYAVRILLLVVASLVLTYTSTSTALTAAFASFLSPLRRLRVPADDVAMVLSIALRFIPLTAEEFCRVHDAQWARGASFDGGGLWRRLGAWATIFIPLFVDLFRRADALAVAMDARCYGAPGVARTSLSARRLAARDARALVAGLALCAAVSLL